MPLDLVQLPKCRVGGKVPGRDIEGPLRVLGGEVGLVQVTQVNGRESQARRDVLGRGLDRVLQQGNRLGRLTAAQVIVGHLDRKRGVARIEIKALAVTFPSLFRALAFLGKEPGGKPRQGVGLTLRLGFQTRRRRRLFVGQQVGHSRMGRDADKASGNSEDHGEKNGVLRTRNASSCSWRKL